MKISCILLFFSAIHYSCAQQNQAIPSLHALCLNLIVKHIALKDSKITETKSHLPIQDWEEIKKKSLYSSYRKSTLPHFTHTPDHRSFCTIYEATDPKTKMIIVSPDHTYIATVTTGNNQVSVTELPSTVPLLTESLPESPSKTSSHLLCTIKPEHPHHILKIQFYNDDTLLCFHQRIPTDSVYMSVISLKPVQKKACLNLESSIIPAISCLPSKDLLFFTEPLSLSRTVPFAQEHFRIAILNMHTYTILGHKHKHTEHINALHANVQMPSLISASNDKNIHIWRPIENASDDQAWQHMHCTATLSHTDPVKTICSSPDGSYILSGTYNNSSKESDGTMQFYLWETATNSCIFTLPLYETKVRMPISCSWSCDNNSIFLYGKDFFYETSPQRLLAIAAAEKKLVMNATKEKIEVVSLVPVTSVEQQPAAVDTNNNNNNNQTAATSAVSRVPSY